MVGCPLFQQPLQNQRSILIPLISLNKGPDAIWVSLLQLHAAMNNSTNMQNLKNYFSECKLWIGYLIAIYHLV